MLSCQMLMIVTLDSELNRAQMALEDFVIQERMLLFEVPSGICESCETFFATETSYTSVIRTGEWKLI